MEFRNLKNKNNILNSVVEKAYVEGIYNDSIKNRKLGRVGMSYREYERMLRDRGEYVESHKEKYDKNKIPVNIGDLNFDKEGKAHYEVEGKNVDITLVSHIKHGEKNFTLNIDGEEYKDLNTTELGRRLRAISQGNYYFGDKFMSNNLPTSVEDFDKLYGDIGFNYTYYKDNLDIKVWIREDSDKKNPRFNIYVIDSDTKKRKSYTDLSLLAAHNKLLEFDLNPNIDKPLSEEQLRKFKKLKAKDKISEKWDFSEASEKLGIDLDDGGKAKFKLEDGFCKIEVPVENHSLVNIIVLDKEGKVQGIDYTTVEDFENFVDNYGLNLKKENQVEYFEKKESGLRYSKHTPEGEMSYYDNLRPTIDKPLKDVIENYSDKQILYDLINGTYHEDDNLYSKYSVSEEDRDRLKPELRKRKLLYLPGQKRDWNREIREAYVFINSDGFKKWVEDLPHSNKEGVTKKKIYEDMKKLSDRFSNSSSIIYGAFGVKKYIIDNYF